MAELTLEYPGIDEVWFLPSPEPPHKMHEGVGPFSVRLAMVQALIANRPGLVAVPLEDALPRPSYTIDTVLACQRWYPGTHFLFLLGSDSLQQLPGWHRARELTEHIRFLVAVRSGYPFDQTLAETSQYLPALQADPIEMPILDISSSWIRERLRSGLSVCGLVPDEIVRIWNQGR